MNLYVWVIKSENCIVCISSSLRHCVHINQFAFLLQLVLVLTKIRSLLPQKLVAEYKSIERYLVAVSSYFLNSLGTDRSCKAIDMLELNCKLNILVRKRSDSLLVSISPVDLGLIHHLRSIIVGKLNNLTSYIFLIETHSLSI